MRFRRRRNPGTQDRSPSISIEGVTTNVRTVAKTTVGPRVYHSEPVSVFGVAILNRPSQRSFAMRLYPATSLFALCIGFSLHPSLAAATDTPIILAQAETAPSGQAQTQAPAAGAEEPVEQVETQVPATPDAFAFRGTMSSDWTRQMVESIAQDVHVTIPRMIHDREYFDEGTYVWDAWPLRTPDGAVAEIDGWVILVGLSSEWTEVEESERQFFTLSELRYWYTKDGEWQPGGLIFPRTDGLGSRQWAGSALYDPDTQQATFFYTAVGNPEAPSLDEDPAPGPVSIFNEAIGRPSTVQRLASVTASVSAGDEGVTFADFGEHAILLEADGFWYDTYETYLAQAAVYGFRDPEYWRDPKTGAEHLLFTANAGGVAGPYNGAIGVATRGEDGAWVMEPPLLISAGVNSQLERPHIVVRDGALYLFFSTHDFTFSDTVGGPRGLYGFISTSGDLRGMWTPLNGHGLVAANPADSAAQVYSFLVLPDGKVMSYLNILWGFDTRPEYADLEFFGAPAPMFQLSFDGPTVTVSGHNSRPQTPAGSDASN